MTERRRKAIRILILCWLIAAVAGDIGLALGPMPPFHASDEASSESTVMAVLALAGWPIFSGVLATLAFTLFVNRFAPHEGDTDPRELRGNRSVQIAWISASIAIVLILAVYGTVALAQDQPGAGIATSSAPRPQPASPSEPLEVQVIGQQWFFTYRYPTYGGVETAQLVLPVGQKVELHVTSLDVVHSFWYYAMGVKADAVPQNDNVFTVTPNQMGTFRVQCSELCGLWHGNMSDDTAMVVSSSDFASWIQQQQAANGPIQKYLPPYSHTYAPSPLAYGS